MMKYAKLINNAPEYAPNPILYNGFRIGNPRPSLLQQLGYKTVRLSNQPEPVSETGWWVEVWTETGTEILQGWSWYEPSEPDPGGASPV